MSKFSIKGEKAREILLKYPKASDNALAKLLLKENPLLIRDLNNARNLIQWHQGKKTGAGRYRSSDPIVRNNGHTRNNPLGLPSSHEEKREPYILPKVNNNILIISDLHIPYHTIDALECAIKYGLEQKVNTIFINGDLLDCYQFSRFEKDPRKRSAAEEIGAAKEFLYTLRKLFPKAGIYFSIGNHDLRYEKWLMQHPEIFGDPYFELETRLDLIKLKIHQIGDKQITKAGKLNIHHGHYIFRGGTSPVSPARTILLKAKQSMICGHTHKISEATGINISGEICTCWSSGSLCELTPDYSPMCNDYSHGFAHVKVNDDGTFMLKNIRIYEGKIL